MTVPAQAVATPIAVPAAARPPFATALAILPGLGVAVAVTAAAFAARRVPGVGSLSPLILGMVFGMLAGNLLGVPLWAKPGLAFAMRRLLRLAIVLLGFQITIGQVADVGLTGLAILVATLGATFLVTIKLGRLLGVDPKLAELIAAGTSICGASAVIATNEVTRGGDDDVCYAVACVTVFGSIAMLLYPLVPDLAGLGARAYGFWAGASIHEVAQVVAASYQHGEVAGEAATVAKLSRVLMLAPVVLTLGFIASRRDRIGGGAWKAPAPPLFVLGFLATMILASTGLASPATLSKSAIATQLLLATSLAAMGMETSFARLAGKGVRPLLLGALATLFISGFSLLLVLGSAMV